MNPFISICIPAYKNKQYLDTLLSSVQNQLFKDFEVIVTDDSPDNEVKDLCTTYSDKLNLSYSKNNPSKGSPGNWNAAIKMAKGAWIKIMHDDDWFANEKSLGIFAHAAKENPQVGFIFSGYTNYENGVIKKEYIPGSFAERKLKDPVNLVSQNFIGHPSTTLVKNNRANWYDENTKWVVDIDFYISCLQATSFCIISEALINIGINNEQITKMAFRNSAIEIPEYLYLLDKLGEGILKNKAVYDHYWRLFRNLNIRSFKQIETIIEKKELPQKLKKMLRMEFRIPLAVLKIGALSKSFMIISFYTNRN